MRGTANERGLAPVTQGDLGGTEIAQLRMAELAHRTLLTPQTSPAPRTPLALLTRLREALDGVSGLGWSVIGFVLGAVFWHFVGFWSFVSDVVLAGHQERAVISRAALPEQRHLPEVRAPYVRTADASSGPSSCISLVLDRRTGVTSGRSCDAGFVPLVIEPFGIREDRVVAPKTAEDWIAPHAPAGALGGGDP